MKQSIKNHLLVILALCPFLMQAQNIGIGTTTPAAGLHIVSNNGIVAQGTLNTGAVINQTGSGSRFIFYPRKGAIRGGYLSGGGANYWDDASTGLYSIGFGVDAKASFEGSIAIGRDALSSAPYAIAIGFASNANTHRSVAIGYNINAGSSTTAGQKSFCIGNGDAGGFTNGSHFATGTESFAIGNNSRSLGKRAFALGNDCYAGNSFTPDDEGRYAFAFGNTCYATGMYSFAFGNNANTSSRTGSMVFGSRIDGISVDSPGDYHFLAQFAGGYQLQSNNAGSLGVYLQPNASSWGSLCDSTKKEQVLLMDDDEVLKKLASINYYSWKYKDDPDVQNRHYGIMAQDFYAAFGKDKLGRIGSDTLVNPIDLLGVAYSAIKALEKKTKEIDNLAIENNALKARLEKLEAIIYKKENYALSK